VAFVLKPLFQFSVEIFGCHDEVSCFLVRGVTSLDPCAPREQDEMLTSSIVNSLQFGVHRRKVRL
jgi:hypothetical protein